jgi:hypothetical protein
MPNIVRKPYGLKLSSGLRDLEYYLTKIFTHYWVEQAFRPAASLI